MGHVLHFETICVVISFAKELIVIAKFTNRTTFTKPTIAQELFISVVILFTYLCHIQFRKHVPSINVGVNNEFIHFSFLAPAKENIKCMYSWAHKNPVSTHLC